MARGRTAQTAQTEDQTVSDINETPDTEDTTEAGTEAAGHKFNVGDEATVIRGKFRGRKGEIIAHTESDNTYAVRLDGGTLSVLNAGNLKAPQDSTVSVSALVKALHGFGQEAGPADRDAAIRLAAMLDEAVPGVSVKLNEAFSA